MAGQVAEVFSAMGKNHSYYPCSAVDCFAVDVFVISVLGVGLGAGGAAERGDG